MKIRSRTFLLAISLSVLALPVYAAAPQAATAVTASPASAIDAILKEYDKPGSPGIAIAVYKDGKAVYSNAAGLSNLEQGGAVTPDTVFHVASVSKQFTTFAIALLIRDGKVNLDEDIHTYLPWVPDFGHIITVRDLVHHTGGIKDTNLLYRLAQRDNWDHITQAQIVSLVKNQKTLGYEPGTRFAYSNTDHILLAELVKSVTGKTLRQFADERIFKPLGMNHTFYRDDSAEPVPNRAESYEQDSDGRWRRGLLNFEYVGSTGLDTTVNDLMKWASNFFNPVVGDRALIDSLPKGSSLKDGSPVNYGYGLWKDEFAGHPAIGHTGSDSGFRSSFYYFPGENFAVAIAANMPINRGLLTEKITALYLGAKPKAVSTAGVGEPPVTLGPKTLATMTGHYLDPKAWAVDLLEKEGKLYWDSTVKPMEPVTVRARDSFSYGLGEFTRYFRFERAKDGKIKGFYSVGGVGTQRGALALRVALYVPTAAEIEEIAGDYRAGEIDTTYQFRVVDGKLVASALWSNKLIHFRTAQRDQYDADDFPMGGVRVIRDANGKIAGLEIVAGGLIGTRFDRLPVQAN